MRLARSAPARPTVWPAVWPRSTPGARRTRRAWHLEDGAALGEIGALDVDAAVEAAGAEQGRVEDLRAVRGADDDEARGGVEAVELREELVQGLLALVVAADGSADPARLAHRVELVDEEDAGGLLPRLGEQIADARGAHADEHLDELGAATR